MTGPKRPHCWGCYSDGRAALHAELRSWSTENHDLNTCECELCQTAKAIIQTYEVEVVSRENQV